VAPGVVGVRGLWPRMMRGVHFVPLVCDGLRLMAPDLREAVFDETRRATSGVPWPSSTGRPEPTATAGRLVK
jgi:hypothetical protein